MPSLPCRAVPHRSAFYWATASKVLTCLQLLIWSTAESSINNVHRKGRTMDSLWRTTESHCHSARVVAGTGQSHTLHLILCAWTNTIEPYSHLDTRFLLLSLGSYENPTVASICAASGKWEIAHSRQTWFKNQLGMWLSEHSLFILFPESTIIT